MIKLTLVWEISFPKIFDVKTSYLTPFLLTSNIFEARKYNEKIDRHENTLYMIHDDEDFAKQVAQAIMLEQMKLWTVQERLLSAAQVDRQIFQ